MISKKEYENALSIVSQYKKEQNALLYPKIIIDRTTRYSGFWIIDKCIQLSSRKFEDTASIYFPNSGSYFSNFQTLLEFSFLPKRKSDKMMNFDEMEKKINSDDTMLIFFLIKKIRNLKQITKEKIETIVLDYESQFPTRFSGNLIKIDEEGSDDISINIKVPCGIAYWYSNYNIRYWI